MTTLAQIISDGRLDTDKNSTHSYVEHFYEAAFQTYRARPITLIEIGVHLGGSLEMWARYFPQGHVIGVDANLSVNRAPALDNATVIERDAYTRTTLSALPACDIFIDDGSHELSDQCWAVQHYSHKVHPGGIFVIEDVACVGHFATLKAATPTHLQPHIECLDLRHIKNRFDDLLFIIHIPS